MAESLASTPLAPRLPELRRLLVALAVLAVCATAIVLKRINMPSDWKAFTLEIGKLALVGLALWLVKAEREPLSRLAAMKAALCTIMVSVQADIALFLIGK